MTAKINFAKGNETFYTTLNKRVSDYFRSNGISPTANIHMFIKTLFMLTLFVAPYILSLIYGGASIWLYLLFSFVMGLGMAGIGLSIMHDANHGAYSTKKWVNRLFGYSLNMIGGHVLNWKIQHNVLHHTYTNIFDMDEDISPRGPLRMAPSSPWMPAHRFQYLYAWFLYTLMTLVWICAKDFSRLIRYQSTGLVNTKKTNLYLEWTVLIVTKIVYLGYALWLPTILLPFAFWQILIGFLVMHAVAGFILAIIFQPAHVCEGTEYFMPDAEGGIENNWAIHQLHTTTNFANKNLVLSWYVGGLNYQVEHHLFPNICHIHYRKLSSIVKNTAAEFGVPYKEKETFWDALKAHGNLLKALGDPNFGLTPAPIASH